MISAIFTAPPKTPLLSYDCFLLSKKKKVEGKGEHSFTTALFPNVIIISRPCVTDFEIVPDFCFLVKLTAFFPTRIGGKKTTRNVSVRLFRVA
jgi:hypothetical protein